MGTGPSAVLGPLPHTVSHPVLVRLPVTTQGMGKLMEMDMSPIQHFEHEMDEIGWHRGEQSRMENIRAQKYYFEKLVSVLYACGLLCKTYLLLWAVVKKV